VSRKEEKTGSEYGGEDDVGTSQLDIATSFLAIILLYFVIMVAFSVGTGRSHVDTTYVHEDPATIPVSLRTFRYVYPFQEVWLVQNARAARVHFPAIAERVATGEGNTIETAFADGTRVVVGLDSSNGPSSFVLRLHRPLRDSPPAVGEGPFDAVVPLRRDQEPALEGFARGALFLVWREDLAVAFPLLGGLQRAGKNPQIAEVNELCQGRWCPGIRRDPSSFALEEVFR
jgi:hypothetical protein